MAERDSNPIINEVTISSHTARQERLDIRRRLLPIGLCAIIMMSGCFGGGNRPNDEGGQESSETPAQTTAARSPQSNAALTRVASSLIEDDEPVPTTTPTPVDNSSSEIPLPTVTPTIVPSPVATRTIELSGDATLRLKLNSDSFESDGQPVTVAIEQRNYVLGGDSLTHSDNWCMQLGPTGLVFDLNYALQPTSENLSVNGELHLYDGFCGEWGKLGNLLATVPVNVTVPAGTSAKIAPTIQAQGSFMGLPNLLDITTGVFLNLNIRNPSPE